MEKGERSVRDAGGETGMLLFVLLTSDVGTGCTRVGVSLVAYLRLAKSVV